MSPNIHGSLFRQRPIDRADSANRRFIRSVRIGNPWAQAEGCSNYNKLSGSHGENVVANTRPCLALYPTTLTITWRSRQQTAGNDDQLCLRGLRPPALFSPRHFSHLLKYFPSWTPLPPPHQTKNQSPVRGGNDGLKPRHTYCSCRCIYCPPAYRDGCPSCRVDPNWQ